MPAYTPCTLTMGTLTVLCLLTVLHAAVIQPGANAAHGVPPQIIEDVEHKFRIPKGQKQFRLLCPVVAAENEKLMIEWMKNGEQIEWDSRYKMSRDNRELRLKNVRLDDSGRYQCQVTNGFGYRTVDFTIHVFDPEDNSSSVKDKLVLTNSTSAPNWMIDMDLEWSSPIQVNRGGRLELRCPARGNPMPEIRWYKNNMLLTIDTPNYIASLVVDPASIEDSGDYRCVVENRLGSIDALFKVVVADLFDEPRKVEHDEGVGIEPVIDSPYNISVKVGHTAQFQCKAKSSETPLIKWLKEVHDVAAVKKADPNATIVSTNGMHLLVLHQQTQLESVSRDSDENLYINRLIIPSVTSENEGRYICVVTSSQGHIVYKAAHLNVIHVLDLRSVDLKGVLWALVGLGVVIFIFCVGCAIVFLRRSQEHESPKSDKPPPPPRIPPPLAPGTYTPSLNRSFNHEMTLEKARTPVMLHNSMFKAPMGIRTLDRHNVQRQQIGYDEMSNLYDSGSPQPYWSRQQQPVYAPASGNYRTLEAGYSHGGRPHPSLYSSDYAEQEPFIYRQ